MYGLTWSARPRSGWPPGTSPATDGGMTDADRNHHRGHCADGLNRLAYKRHWKLHRPLQRVLPQHGAADEQKVIKNKEGNNNVPTQILPGAQGSRVLPGLRQPPGYAGKAGYQGRLPGRQQNLCAGGAYAAGRREIADGAAGQVDAQGGSGRNARVVGRKGRPAARGGSR